MALILFSEKYDTLNTQPPSIFWVLSFTTAICTVGGNLSHTQRNIHCGLEGLCYHNLNSPPGPI